MSLRGGVIEARHRRFIIGKVFPIRSLLSLGSVTLFFFFLATIFPLVQETNYTEATSGTASETTLTLSSSDVSLSLAPSMAGSFSSSTSDEKSTISVVTNNYTGYTLKIAGSGTDTTSSRLINADDDTKYLSTISDPVSPSSFDTAVYNNKWGYQPSKYNSTTNTNYLPAPSITGDTIDKTTIANSTKNDYALAIGTRADLTNPAGDYNTVFIIAAIANPIAYSIAYNSNTTATVSDMPSTQSASEFTGTEVTLSSNTPTRTNYSFQGWCQGTVNNKDTTSPSCTGTTYQPGNTFPINQTTSNNVNLYAIWKANTYTITLNNQSATTAGTSTIYESYGEKYSLTSTGSAMTTSANPITIPQKTYTISYNANGQGATYTGSPTSSSATFGGYYTSTGGSGTQYIGATGYLTSSASTTNFSADGTLYAKWTNNSITLPAISKTGYTCKWAEGSASGTQYAGGTSRTISANTTYYAVCTANTYTITLNNQSATTAGTATIYETYGSKYSLTSGGNAMTTSNNPITKPARAYTYTISYNANSQGATYTGSPTSATRTDTFNGYYTATSGGTQYIGSNGYLTSSASTTNFSADGTLYAQWTNGSATFTLPAITKTGYTCKWAEGSASGTQYAGGTSRTISANTTYYAVCTINKYTVTISVNASGYGTVSASSVASVPYGSTISTSSNTVTVNGTKVTATPATKTTQYTYSFSSWTNNCGTTMPNNTCTITANFTRTTNVYTVSLNNQSATTAGTTAIYETYGSKYSLTSGGTAMSTSANPITIPQKTYTISYNANGQGATYTGSPTSSSATFGGYYTSTGGSGTQYIGTTGYLTSSASTTNFSADGTLYAKWTNNSITLPAITKTGYTCKWAEGSASGTQYAGGTSRTISANTTYYAVCTANTYTITLNNQSATTAGTATIYETYGSKYSLTSGGNAMTTSANPITKPARTYTYTISYNANSQGATYTGSPTSATRTDTFNGYYTAASGGTQYIGSNGYLTSSASNTNFSANGTLYAQWTNGSATFTLPAITKTGYTCKWAEGSASGTQYAGGTSRTISANTTYYAVCVVALNNITNMQEMTNDICANSAEHETKQLKDTRDNKLYWVTKMKDNSCWMTQNLDYDLSTSKPLTPDDSDVASNYTPVANTSTSMFSSSSANAQYSYDGGDYYWKGIWESSATSTGGYGASTLSNSFSINISDAGPAAEHYHVGNIYQFNTAAAGTGSVSTGNAPSSICPKGWGLPSSTVFNSLKSAYGLTNNATGASKTIAEPIYILPAGSVSSNALKNAAYRGTMWFNSVSGSGNAYSVTLYQSSVYNNYGYLKYVGMPIRCVAK